MEQTRELTNRNRIAGAVARRVYAELRQLGVPGAAAAQVAANARRWWHNAAMLVQLGLTIRYFDRLGVPRLAD